MNNQQKEGDPPRCYLCLSYNYPFPNRGVYGISITGNGNRFTIWACPEHANRVHKNVRESGGDIDRLKLRGWFE